MHTTVVTVVFCDHVCGLDVAFYGTGEQGPDFILYFKTPQNLEYNVENFWDCLNFSIRPKHKRFFS